MLFFVSSTGCYGQITNLSIFSSYNDNDNIVVIDHGDFLIYYDTLQKMPKYTIHILYNNERRQIERKPFKYDGKIDRRYQRGKSYYDSLNKGNHKYDRGHMVSFADMSINNIMANKTMIYTNCIPQHYQLNRNKWRKMENHFRKFVERKQHFLIVITGCIYSSGKIPDKIYKIYHSPVYQESIAFIANNSKSVGDFFNDSITVDKLESITGEDFFYLTKVIEDEYNITYWKK